MATGSTSINVSEEGLTVLYEPQSKPPAADLIFVHGLQGHPQKTWQFGPDTVEQDKKRHRFFLRNPKNDTPSTENASQVAVFWPRDILPLDQFKARTLTYGYDSRVSHFFNGPANQLNISQQGEALLNSVAGERVRSKAHGRRIIFIAHSLGGLLVKEALIEAKKQHHNASKMDVYAATEATVFFGTPHLGSDDAKWGLIVQSIASSMFDTNDKILQSLQVDSELLDRLARDFQDILDTGKLRVCSLQEAAGKAGLPIFNGKESTSLYLVEASCCVFTRRSMSYVVAYF